MATLLRIVWRNIWRNPRRTLLTLAAIAFSCVVLVFMVALQIGSYDTMISTSVRTSAGHLQVQAEGYHESYSMREAIRDPEVVDAALAEIPQIAVHTARARALCLASSEDRSYGVMVSGIDPEREAQVTRIADQIRDGEYLSPTTPNGGLLGELLARNLKVGVGDEVTIIGQGFDGSVAATVVTIIGIFNTGLDELDRQILYIPLATFDDVFSMRGAVHEIVALCDTLSDVAPAKAALVKALDGRTGGADSAKAADAGSATPREALVVLDWDELIPGLMQSIRLDLSSALVFYLALIIVVAFSILNTFLMAFFERIRELGVLLALGMTPRRLVRLFLLESVLLTGLGVLLGCVGGCILTYYYQIHGLDIGGETTLMAQYGLSATFYPRLTLATALTGPLAVLVITSLAALYPALKILRLRPVEAMNHV